MRVTIDTDRNYIRFGDITIIQALMGDTGFDPLNQRETIGVKATVGDRYVGFWIETQKLRPEQTMYALGKMLINLAENPEDFFLTEAFTPEPLHFVLEDFEGVNSAWEEDDEMALAG